MALKSIVIPLVTAAILGWIGFTFAISGDVATLKEKASHTERRYVEINRKLDRLIFYIMRKNPKHQ
jgi:hypothetical protein